MLWFGHYINSNFLHFFTRGFVLLDPVRGILCSVLGWCGVVGAFSCRCSLVCFCCLTGWPLGDVRSR